MSGYVLIGSSDPLEATDGRRLYELADGLVDHGDDVTVFLVQNGVLPCRPGSDAAETLRSLAERTTVIADDFSLRERAIAADGVVTGVSVAGIDTLIDTLMDDGRKAVWF
jgi:hypothetical protein